MSSSDKLTLIYADGASSGNPGPSGWGAIVKFPSGQVHEMGGHVSRATNNEMELRATIEALRLAQTETSSSIAVHTDSSYVINGITKWVRNWKKRGWKTVDGNDVANIELWEELDGLVTEVQKHSKLDWRHVRGHQGNIGNERVDTIAVSFSKGKPIRLYEGPIEGYSVKAFERVPKAQASEIPSPRKNLPKYPIYLSWVGRDVIRHLTWSACEARVKGQSGAKFKKAANYEQEYEILRSWGFTHEDLRDER